MKACVLEGIGQLVYKEIPTPVPKENEVLLRVRACGICSSDIDRVFRSGAYHFPIILGHEFSGEIVEIGRNVDPSYLNKHAVVFPLIPCFKCPACESGAYARCESYNYFGSRCDGAFAEFVAVPIWNIVPFSETLPYSSAALCEPASVALHAISSTSITPHDTVTIIGNGTIGLLAAAWARIRGAKKVIIIGRGKEKVDFARSIGFLNTVSSLEIDIHSFIYEETQGIGSDIVVELVGSSEAVNMSLDLVKKGGQVVLTGNPQSNIELNRDRYWKILRGELSVQGIWNSSYNKNVNDWITVIRAFEQGLLQPEKLITHRFPLRECGEAFELLRQKNETVIKVMFDMSL